jgi:decaprenylphospho-beta-D-erythro-pentofuranosid-2-ulose 2-reductase
VAGVNDSLGLPQSILVLGGSSEIGRAVVRALLAKRGARVVVAGRPSPARDEAVEEARQLGALHVGAADFDALDPASVERAVDETFDAGDVDLVVVAFGVLGSQEASEADPLSAVETATVNYTAAVVAGLAVARRLRTQGHGTIVALSTVAGERVRRANFVYGSSKAGMDGFFQGLGDALDGTGARVMIVRPGFVRSRMTKGIPAAPMATDPDTVAAAVVAGLAKRQPIVWVPATLRPAFIVFRHLPRAVWRRMPQ